MPAVSIPRASPLGTLSVSREKRREEKRRCRRDAGAPRNAAITDRTRRRRSRPRGRREEHRPWGRRRSSIVRAAVGAFLGALASRRQPETLESSETARFVPWEKRQDVGDLDPSSIAPADAGALNFSSHSICRLDGARCSASGVPEARDLHHLSLVVHSIDDSIGSQDQFADFGVVQLGNDAPAQWEGAHRAGFLEEQLAESLSRPWTVERDVAHDPLQILDRARGEDYLVSHE
jgi:hypothetical protein